MADTKISALTALTGANVATADELVLVDKSDTTMAASGTDKRITAAELIAAVMRADLNPPVAAAAKVYAWAAFR